jgi:dihydrofolate synthase/folylpolyglutamate synthase
MDYSEAIAWLYGCQQRGIKLGLGNTHLLLRALGVNESPKERPRYIHVAGTNGKGSVCAMLDAICRAQGYRAGLFTSPHLISFRERIRFNGSMIAEADVAEGLTRIKALVSGWETHPTFFEITTALALSWFENQNADIVVLETGMGGRLDSTNAITPVVSVITPIGFDHQEWLGNTLADIAGEKAGILKPGIPAVSSPQCDEAAAVLLKKAPQTRFIAAPLESFPVALAGSHQKWNAALAVEALRAGHIVTEEPAIRSGLATVSWQGRFQFVQERFVLDGAHNEAAASQLAETWREQFGDESATVILGVLADKKLEAIVASLAPIAAAFIATRVKSPRTFTEDQVASRIREAAPGIGCEAAADLFAAIALAQRRAHRILITGSLFLVGEALSILQPGGMKPELSSQ